MAARRYTVGSWLPVAPVTTIAGAVVHHRAPVERQRGVVADATAVRPIAALAAIIARIDAISASRAIGRLPTHCG
jgi:hypothetical protein